jgi:hypothetical protein
MKDMTDMRAAAHLTPGTRCVAPQVAYFIGSNSALSTGGNPIVGTDAVITVARVRDAKQAAPPRGVLH